MFSIKPSLQFEETTLVPLHLRTQRFNKIRSFFINYTRSSKNFDFDQLLTVNRASSLLNVTMLPIFLSSTCSLSKGVDFTTASSILEPGQQSSFLASSIC